MKGKTKVDKGITLIALIITIVVLLILASVAISSITNDGILSYAQNAAKDYNQAQTNEKDLLGKYELMLEANSKKFKENSTINGEAYGAYNPIIPAGFAPIDTETSSWNAADLSAEVKKGLVISDGTSEFVWIPVENINEMVRVTSGTDANGKINYQGILYKFLQSDDGTVTPTEMEGYGQGTTSFREPSNMEGYDNIENFPTWTENLYQERFNKMVESVTKYKGFYVGRYETSLNSNGIAQSVSGVIPMNNINWFRMYENSLTYANEQNTKLGVISEMIWGCQWDAMIKFILKGSEAEHVLSTTNVGHIGSEFTSAPYYTGGVNYNSVYTGSIAYNDIASNIYDLEGNQEEWTQEAYIGGYRVARGGNADHIYSMAGRASYDTSVQTRYSKGSRLMLYVEI